MSNQNQNNPPKLTPEQERAAEILRINASTATALRYLWYLLAFSALFGAGVRALGGYLSWRHRNRLLKRKHQDLMKPVEIYIPPSDEEEEKEENKKSSPFSGEFAELLKTSEDEKVHPYFAYVWKHFREAYKRIKWNPILKALYDFLKISPDRESLDETSATDFFLGRMSAFPFTKPWFLPSAILLSGVGYYGGSYIADKILDKLRKRQINKLLEKKRREYYHALENRLERKTSSDVGRIWRVEAKLDEALDYLNRVIPKTATYSSPISEAGSFATGLASTLLMLYLMNNIRHAWRPTSERIRQLKEFNQRVILREMLEELNKPPEIVVKRLKKLPKPKEEDEE